MSALFFFSKTMTNLNHSTQKMTRNRFLMVVMILFAFAVKGMALTWVDSETGISWTYTKLAQGSASYARNIRPTNNPTNLGLIEGDITIPSTIADLPAYSIFNAGFKNCTELTSITIPASVVQIGDTSFGTAENLGVFYGCSSLKTIIFEEGSQLKTIGRYAFAYSGIESITFNSQSLTSLTNSSSFYLFEGCTNLKSIDFSGSGLTTMQSNWLASASDAVPLEEIHLPSTMTSVANSTNNIFANLGNLRSIYLDKENPTSPNFAANDATFNSLHDCTIYLPSETAVEAFRADSYWKIFESEELNRHYEVLVEAYTPILTFSPSTFEVAYTEEAVASPALTITNDKGKVVTLDVTYASEDNTVAEVDPQSEQACCRPCLFRQQL